jgi:hypothetical protein
MKSNWKSFGSPFHPLWVCACRKFQLFLIYETCEWICVCNKGEPKGQVFWSFLCFFSEIWDGPLLLNVRGERGSGSKLRWYGQGRQRSKWREKFDGRVLPEHFDKDKTFPPYLINKGTYMYNSTTIVSASAGWKIFKEAFTRDCYYKRNSS